MCQIFRPSCESLKFLSHPKKNKSKFQNNSAIYSRPEIGWKTLKTISKFMICKKKIQSFLVIFCKKNYKKKQMFYYLLNTQFFSRIFSVEKRARKVPCERKILPERRYEYKNRSIWENKTLEHFILKSVHFLPHSELKISIKIKNIAYYFYDILEK